MKSSCSLSILALFLCLGACGGAGDGACAGGEIETTITFSAAGDGMECEMPSVYCISNDEAACAQ